MLKLASALLLLVPLAASAAEPLVVNNVCPEGPGWPTAQQGPAATGAFAWNIGSGPTFALDPGEAGILIRDTSSWVGYKWTIS